MKLEVAGFRKFIYSKHCTRNLIFDTPVNSGTLGDLDLFET
jgi:hypothetical protein